MSKFIKSTLPTSTHKLLTNVQRHICLPYELSILEIDRILKAIKVVGGGAEVSVKLFKGDVERLAASPSAFDILSFLFDEVYQLPTAICMLTHEPTNSTIYWDEEERFVLIAGSKMFCECSFPHSREVLEHFYVQSAMNEFEDEDTAREFFDKLTSHW